MLKLGSKGGLVAAWQKFVGVSIDGEFGEKTAAATRFFQSENGLRADGIVGAQTLTIAQQLGFVVPITSEMLAKLFPGTKKSLRDRFLPAFNEFLPKYGIVTRKRVAAFLANGGKETDYLKTTTEYASGADYEGRTGLGNTQKGDGRRFKGRGFFQTTGRFNYGQVTKATQKRLGIDFVKNPEKLAEIPIAVESACIFWEENDCEKYADAGDIFGVSGIVNRGSAKKKALGYDERLALYNKCLTVLPEKVF